MQDLSFNEVEEVSGGITFLGAVAVGAGIGVGGGLVLGLAAYLAYQYIQEM